MKQFLFRLCFVVAVIQSVNVVSTAQVVINEILLNTEFVELKNIGDTVVNVSQYYLVFGTNSKRIGSRFPLCGNGIPFDIQPGGFLLTDVISDYPADDGELAMFRNEVITDPANILDYVEWGSGDHGNEGIAVAAGIWESGDYVEAILDGGSLEYDGDGDHSSDWESVAVPSSCAENGQKCEANIAVVVPEMNPFQVCIGDEALEYFGFDFSGSTVQHRRVVVLDNEDLIVSYSEDLENLVDLSSLTPDDTAGLHVVLLGYRGPIGLLGVGMHIDSLVGCYFVSDPVDLWAGFIDQGELTATYGDSVYNSLIYVCAGDQIADSMVFRNSSSASQNAFIVVDPENNTVLDIAFDSLVIDFEDALNNTLLVRSLSYSDSLSAEIGGPVSSVHGVPCEFFASNDIVIQTDSCISALTDHFGNAFLEFYPNPVGDILTIPGLPDDTFVVNIYQGDGRLVMTDRIPAGSGNDLYQVNTSELPEGMYILRSIGHTGSLTGTFVKETAR